MKEEHILQELNITDDVLAIFQYGSHVYGTANAESDRDFIIVVNHPSTLKR
jgi:predicted nucleotidyltransferase